MIRLTFDEYIRNPTGGRSRIVGSKDIARAVYSDKYNKMMLRCAGRINYLLFRDKSPMNGDKRFVIYIQMPSEKTEKLYYDVVVDFTAEDDVKRRINNLDGYHVRFFSNDPNFIYTYAYAFNKDKLIIPELISKINPKALNDAPKHTNPHEMAGYVKSFYFAYLFMLNKGLFNKNMWLNAASLTEMNAFFKRYVMTSDKKIIYAQQYKQVVKAKQKGDSIKVSSSDEKGVEKAAKATVTRAKLIRKVEKVNRSTSTVNKIKSIGKR